MAHRRAAQQEVVAQEVMAREVVAVKLLPPRQGAAGCPPPVVTDLAQMTLLWEVPAVRRLSNLPQRAGPRALLSAMPGVEPWAEEA